MDLDPNNPEETMPDAKPRQGKVESVLMKLLYSHPHGWAPIGVLEKTIRDMGFSISSLERDNRTDGEYHKRFNKGDKVFNLHGNYWDAKTIEPLIVWIDGI